MNCSGGRMPWGAWITCEETINGPDVGPDFTGVSNIPLTKPHGYIFEVPAGGQSTRQPITQAGRFAHEAVSFDPDEGILYLTEDNFGFPSGFYRYIPATNPMETGMLDNEGQLQMLAVKGQPNVEPGRGPAGGASRYDVEWVDIDDPDPTFAYTPGATAPTTNDTALTYVGNQGRAKGAAYFSRLEGQVFDHEVVYFTSTQGGGPAEVGLGPIADGYGNGTGQVWAYRPSTSRRSQLHLRVARRRHPGLPGQRHGQPARDAHPVRGQRQRQLPARPVQGGQLFRHRPQPDGQPAHRRQPVQRRVRRLDLQPGRRDPVRQHPGVARHQLRDLGAVGPDRRLTRRRFGSARLGVADVQRFAGVVGHAQHVADRRGLGSCPVAVAAIVGWTAGGHHSNGRPAPVVHSSAGRSSSSMYSSWPSCGSPTRVTRIRPPRPSTRVLNSAGRGMKGSSIVRS